MNALLIYLKKLLSTSGEASTMRLMSIASFLVGAAIAFIGLYKAKDLSGLAQVCAVFVGSAFAGKTISKFAEKKDDL